MTLIASRIRKVGNSYVVTIPADEMKARGLSEGQLVGIDPVPVEIRPAGPSRRRDRSGGRGECRGPALSGRTLMPADICMHLRLFDVLAGVPVETPLRAAP